jgi:hypothetical protein
MWRPSIVRKVHRGKQNNWRSCGISGIPATPGEPRRERSAHARAPGVPPRCQNPRQHSAGLANPLIDPHHSPNGTRARGAAKSPVPPLLQSSKVERSCVTLRSKTGSPASHNFKNTPASNRRHSDVAVRRPIGYCHFGAGGLWRECYLVDAARMPRHGPATTVLELSSEGVPCLNSLY